MRHGYATIRTPVLDCDFVSQIGTADRVIYWMRLANASIFTGICEAHEASTMYTSTMRPSDQALSDIMLTLRVRKLEIATSFDGTHVKAQSVVQSWSQNDQKGRPKRPNNAAFVPAVQPLGRKRQIGTKATSPATRAVP